MERIFRGGSSGTDAQDLRLVARFLLTVLCLLAAPPHAYAQDYPNTLYIFNRSGRPAAVKLLGPTGRTAVIAHGKEYSASLPAGKYRLLVRFGDRSGRVAYFRQDGIFVGGRCGTAAQRKKKSYTSTNIVLDTSGLVPITDREYDQAVVSRKWKEGDIVAKLIDDLNGGDEKVRWLTAEALGDCTDPRAVDALIEALRNKDENTRWRAAEGLGKAGSAKAVLPLVPLLDDETYFVREHAARALGEIGDSRATAPLIAKLSDPHEDIGIQVASANALGNIKDARAVGPLGEMLKDASSDARRVAAATALRDIRDPGSFGLFVNALRDTDSDVRAIAAHALGDMGNREAVPSLLAVLTDWNANRTTAEALSKLGWKPRTDAETVHYLVAARRSDALREKGRLAESVLLGDIESEDSRTIENALYAFIAMGKRELVPVLLDKLREKGNKAMAEAYLNCGYQELNRAATEWAQTHGYSISEGYGAHPVTWGTMR